MWNIEWEKKAKKHFLSLDLEIRKRIIDAVNNKLLQAPNLYLIPLLGDKAGMYKFRVGNYRLLCSKNEKKFIITVIKVKHRKRVYSK